MENVCQNPVFPLIKIIEVKILFVHNKKVLLFPLFLIIVVSSSIMIFTFCNNMEHEDNLNDYSFPASNGILVPKDDDSKLSTSNIIRRTNGQEMRPFESSSLNTYRKCHINKYVEISSSLKAKLQTVPKEKWWSVQTSLIVTFESRLEMFSPVFLKYDSNPEFLQVLPIAIVEVPLGSVEEIKSIPGIRGIYLDQYSILIDDWHNQKSWNDTNASTYPSEAIIGARALQDLGITGAGKTIAILDSGIDKNHPDLDDIDNDNATNDPKVIKEASFVDYDGDGMNDTDTTDELGHGTHCAGIAAGNGYLQGVAPEAYLMNGRVLDAMGGAEPSWIVRGIDWAVSEGADIISMSLGWMPGDVLPVLNDASDTAWESGVMVVVAAGNSGPPFGTISSPGMASRVITVGASDIYNNPTLWSSRGPSITGVVDPDIVAPGEEILSTIPGGSFMVASGTSMATPAVAGVLALLLSANPGTDIDLVRSSILSTAKDLGKHVFEQGNGLVDAEAANDYLDSSTVFAYPSFSENSSLILSPGEVFSYQLDVFLNSSFTSLTIEPSSELTDFVTTQVIDTVENGWVRAIVEVTMPSSSIYGVITINDSGETYYEAELMLQTDVQANDAGSNTDAGETFGGAIPISVGTEIHGEIVENDLDIFSFPVTKDKAYSIELTNLSGDIDFLITDENGTVITGSFNWGLEPEESSFIAQTTHDYFVRVVEYGTGTYDLLVNETEELFYTENPVTLTGKNESVVVDFDEDGLFDELAFIIEMDVNVSGSYDILYTIAQARNDYRVGLYTFISEWITVDLSEGKHNVTLSVPGGILESSNYNGSYVLNDLLLGDPSTWLTLEYLTDVIRTPSYNSTSFTPLENRLLSYHISDEDIDENGSPELIEIELELFISEENWSYIDLFIIDKNHVYILAWLTTDIDVEDPGQFNVTFKVAAQSFKDQSEIVIAGIASPLFDYYIIPMFDKIPYDKLSTFEPLIKYSVDDQLADTDNNGKNDSIRFNFHLISKVKTNVTLFTSFILSYEAEEAIPVYSNPKDVELIVGSNNALQLTLMQEF